MEKETTAGCTNQIWAESPLNDVSHAVVAYLLHIYFKILFTLFELGETMMSVKSSCLMHHA